MDLQPLVALAGLGVGFVVGLTGMGGGALMTPVLVLLFGVQPLAAVSSDLVAAFVMKPVGGAVHLRRGTVDKRLVGWLVVGSVPAAFCGVLLLKSLGDGERVESAVKTALGVALLVAAASIVAKAAVTARQERRGVLPDAEPGPVLVRPLRTALIGAVGGLVVGMTSVGSGSLIIVLLLLLYPTLTPKSLVGTDLVQAVPLVGAAALGHLLYGDFKLGLTTSLLIGSVPGVYLGARVSSRASGALVRKCLVVVLTASALKLLGVPTDTLGIVLVALVAATVAWPYVVRPRVVALPEQGAAPASLPAQSPPPDGDRGPVDLVEDARR